MGLFLSRSSPERQIFCPSSVSLFDLKARFFVPTRRFADVVARRSCQGWPTRQPCGMLRACQAIPLQLRARRHAACDRDDDQRGARFRARLSRATTLYSVGPRTRTMMQSYASAAKLRSGGPILPFGIESQGNTSGLRHLEPSSATRHQRTDRTETVGCPSVTSVHYAGPQNDAVRHHALPHETPKG